MQNFDFLWTVRAVQKPDVFETGLFQHHRGIANERTVNRRGGNPQSISSARGGIRNFETVNAQTLDISPCRYSSRIALPVIVDPSHAAGIRSLVPALSRAAVAAGADGLMIETHNDPASALSDGAQSLDLEQFHALCAEILQRAEYEGKKVAPARP